MSSLLVKNANHLVTIDDHRRELPGGGLFIEDGFISRVRKTTDLPQDADRVLDLTDHIVLPQRRLHRGRKRLVGAVPLHVRLPGQNEKMLSCFARSGRCHRQSQHAYDP